MWKLLRKREEGGREGERDEMRNSRGNLLRNYAPLPTIFTCMAYAIMHHYTYMCMYAYTCMCAFIEYMYAFICYSIHTCMYQ